jgi:hypothetical protein
MVFLRRFNLLDCYIDSQVTSYSSAIYVGMVVLTFIYRSKSSFTKYLTPNYFIKLTRQPPIIGRTEECSWRTYWDIIKSYHWTWYVR